MATVSFLLTLIGFSLAPKTAQRAGAEKEGIPIMFKSTSTSLILLGVLGVIVGVIAIVWPGVTIAALIDLAAGAVALVWPGPTALVLVLVVAIWAFVAGLAEIFAAFGSGETAGTRAMYIVTGLISIAFGVVLTARPGIGAVTLALLFGLFSMIYGVSEIVAGAQMRRTGKTLHSVLQDAA